MYKITPNREKVIPLEERQFKDVQIKERQHLQEWIADNPNMFGEDLLIIQKEFDGFSETNERLDLLALDKKGGLVIIENKLDDTGRDVVWQAIKYASYCSTLTTQQVIDIYQKFLVSQNKEAIALQSISDFIELPDGKELLLNQNDQRIFFVANNYRKEVTSAVMWLIKHDLQIQCFKVTPFQSDEDLFLDFRQIIPLPETSDYMIDIKEKEKEIVQKSKAVMETESILEHRWSMLKQTLEAKNIKFLDKVAIKPYFYIGFGAGRGAFYFNIGRNGYRVELYITYDPEKTYFDAIHQRKAEIEAKFGSELIWERLDGKKASRIKCELPKEQYQKYIGKFREDDVWQEICDWYAEVMPQFHSALMPVWDQVQKQVAVKSKSE